MRNYRYSRFHATATGPQGGTARKSGIERADACFYFDSGDLPARVCIVGEMRGGEPFITVTAYRTVRDQFQAAPLYDGPADLAGLPWETISFLQFAVKEGGGHA